MQTGKRRAQADVARKAGDGVVLGLKLKKIAEENPEKIKEYRRNAYLKRKEKLKNTVIKENT